VGISLNGLKDTFLLPPATEREEAKRTPKRAVKIELKASILAHIIRQQNPGFGYFYENIDILYNWSRLARPMLAVTDVTRKARKGLG
jgi:hypothetical protein